MQRRKLSLALSFATVTLVACQITTPLDSNGQGNGKLPQGNAWGYYNNHPTLEPTPGPTPEPTPAPTSEPTPTPEPTCALIGNTISIAAGGYRNKLGSVYNPVTNEYLVVWDENRLLGTDGDIYAQRVDASGNLLDGETAVCSALFDQTTPAVSCNTQTGEYLVTWQSGYTYGQRLSTSGALLGGAFPIVQVNNTRESDIAFNSTASEFLVVTQVINGVDANGWQIMNLRGQRVKGSSDSSGDLIGTNSLIDAEPEYANFASVAYNTTDKQYLVVHSNNLLNTYGRRVDLNGALLDKFGIGMGYDPAVCYNPSTNEYGVTFTEVSSLRNIGFSRITGSTSANNIVMHTDITSQVANLQDFTPAIAVNTNGSRYLVAFSHRDADTAPTIVRAQSISSLGSIDGSALPVSGATPLAFTPTIASSKANQFLVSWMMGGSPAPLLGQLLGY